MGLPPSPKLGQRRQSRRSEGFVPLLPQRRRIAISVDQLASSFCMQLCSQRCCAASCVDSDGTKKSYAVCIMASYQPARQKAGHSDGSAAATMKPIAQKRYTCRDRGFLLFFLLIGSAAQFSCSLQGTLLARMLL